jgi:hypothetical protein
MQVAPLFAQLDILSIDFMILLLRPCHLLFVQGVSIQRVFALSMCGLLNGMALHDVRAFVDMKYRIDDAGAI